MADIFNRFKATLSKVQRVEESPLTSLNLRTPAPPPLPVDETKAEIPAPAAESCRMWRVSETVKAALTTELNRRIVEWCESGMRPLNVFFGVHPQQGLPAAVTSLDGKQTILLLFDSPLAAKFAFAGLKPRPEVAGCRMGILPEKAEKWIGAGINAFSMNICRYCGARAVYPAQHLLSHDKFAQCYGCDIALRKFRAELLVRDAHDHLAKDRKRCRANLEYVRDHLDAVNPYLHWTIAVLAGLDGDMKANAVSIASLEEFGPPFVGKLKGTAFDFSPDSQFRTIPEALLGLLLSYGILKVPLTPPAAL